MRRKTLFTTLWSEIKVGVTPTFLQYPEYPGEGNWRLLLQLDSQRVPFSVNFGDAGVGYALLVVKKRPSTLIA